MPMRVTCPNCGKQFSAWEDLVGKPVQCPKCQQTTVLGGKNAALDTPPASSLEKPAVPPRATTPPTARSAKAQIPPAGAPTAARAPAPKGVPPSPAGGAGPVPPLPRQPLAAETPSRGPTRPPATGQPAAAARTIPPAAPPQHHPDLDDGDERVPLGCPHCNAPMEPNDDLCDSCGYHLVLKKVIDIADMKTKSRSTGFQRLLEDQLHESETSQSALLWMKLVAGLALVGVLFLCLGKWWWVGVLAVGAVIGFFWFRHRQRVAQAAAGDSEVNQDPLSAVVWSTLLSAQRLLGWRKLSWPFAAARTLTLRDPQFNDRELGELEGLADMEALDLESTGITNDGLVHLRELKQLRFLVVRRTRVTPAAVVRLQQDLPDTLIWY